MFDLVVIGTGAGLMVAEAAAKQGLDVAIIEKGKFGGTCLTKGCIPSKMLVYPADMLREAERAYKVGLSYGKPEIDWPMISKRVWDRINFSKEIEQLKSAKRWTKIDILDLFYTMLPNFGHKETGKYLDSKM